MEDENNRFGSKVNKIKDTLGIKQKELAARLGLSQKTISIYINGIRQPDMNTIQKLIDFGVSPLFLFDDFPEPFDEKYNDFARTYKKQLLQDEIKKREVELEILENKLK